MADFSVDDWNNISGVYRDLLSLSDNVNGKIQEALGGAIVAAQKGLIAMANTLNADAAKLNAIKPDASDISAKIAKYGPSWQTTSGESLSGFFDFISGGMDGNQALAQVAKVGPGLVNYYKMVAADVDTNIKTLTSTPARPMTTAEANVLIKSTRSKQASMSSGMIGGVGLPLAALAGGVGLLVLWKFGKRR